MAGLASRNAADPEYESPYTEEAIRSGMDLPWWQKIVTTTLDFGELKLGKLTVRALAALGAALGGVWGRVSGPGQCDRIMTVMLGTARKVEVSCLADVVPDPGDCGELVVSTQAGRPW